MRNAECGMRPFDKLRDLNLTNANLEIRNLEIGNNEKDLDYHSTLIVGLPDDGTKPSAPSD
jgi:hypothetical protein